MAFSSRPWPSVLCALVALCAWCVLLGISDAPGVEVGTWEGWALGITYPMALGPASALTMGAAIEVGRLRAAGVFSGVRVRPVMQVLLRQVWPLLLACIALPAASTIWGLANLPGPPTLASVALSTLATFTGLGFVALGAAVGRFVPMVIGVPLAAIVGYQLITTALWVPSFHWRHIWGFDWWAWRPELTWVPRLQVVPFITWSAFTAAALVVATRTARRYRDTTIVALITVALLAVTGTGVSLATASHATEPEPLSPRGATGLVCTGERPRVCLWPEHEDLRPRISSNAEEIYALLNSYGVSVHHEVSELESAPWPIFIAPGQTTDLVRPNLLSNYLKTDNQDCGKGSFNFPLFIPYLRVWLGLVADESTSKLAKNWGQDVVTEVEAVRTWPPDRQGRWFMTNWNLGHECNAIPTLDVP